MRNNNSQMLAENNSGCFDQPVTGDFIHKIVQELIDFCPEPGFLLQKDFSSKIIINQKLATLLDYASLEECYLHVKALSDLLTVKDVSRINSEIKKTSHPTQVLTGRYNLLRKGGTVIRCVLTLKPINHTSIDFPCAYMGKLSEIEKSPLFQIDKSLLNMFNDDRFLDEVIVIMDFEGNIMAANRKFFIIDYFTDFSVAKPNLFRIIDKSYQPLLSRRMAFLKKGIPIPPTEFKLAKGDQKSAFVEVYSKAAEYKGQRVIISLIRDISTRKEIEKKLLYAVVQTEEKERQRFAHDLHDELGPFLSGLKLYLQELVARDTDSKRRKMLIDYLGQMTDEAVDKIRTISSNLMPQNMIDAGLSVSIEKMIEKLNQAGHFKINLKTVGSQTGLENSLVITLYRIVLELINNSIKHSGSNLINIKIIYRKSAVNLIYDDNGKGFDLEKTIKLNKGIGLKSIFNRIDLYRGSYKFRRKQSRGIEFSIHFPL